MIEAWGRGIERMRAACVAAGVPEPTFRAEDGNGLWSIFRFAPPPNTSAPVETPERILALLASNPRMTLAQVATTIGKSLSAVERAAARLAGQSRLRFIGPRKGGHWEVLP
jgi:ATP-dependent DNA helicase RecG